MERSEIYKNASLILSRRHKALGIAEEEAWGESQNCVRWSLYDSSVLSYQDEFLAIFHQTFQEFLNERKLNNQGRNVLNIMGQVGILRNLPIEGGLAVSLGDGRRKERKAEDKKKGIDLIAGDILSKKTWGLIRKWLVDNKIPGFDLILCRPGGGLHEIPGNDNLYYYLLNQMWHLLTPNKSILLTETPEFFHQKKHLFYNWIDELKKDNLADYSGFKLKLVRDGKSALDLPTWRATHIVNKELISV